MKKQPIFSKLKTGIATKLKSWFDFGHKQGYTRLPESFSHEKLNYKGDPGSTSAWVYIILDKLIKQFSRAPFQNLSNGKVVESGLLWELFSNSELWEATAGWLFSENEVFWWFGTDFGGIKMPKEIHVLDPRRIYHYVEERDGIKEVVKWVYYSPGGARVPILPDEMIHFRRWNRGSAIRGMSPFVPLIMSLITGQNIDIETAEHMAAGAIPPGLLKTNQVIHENDVKEIQEMWDKTYSRNKGRAKIGVIGNGVEFQSLVDNLEKHLPTAMDCRLTIAAAFGVPPRVVGLQTETTPLSGTDTEQEYLSLWVHTMIPMMNVILETLNADFYRRFRIREEPHFDWEGLPEFAKQRLDQTESVVKLITAGAMTVNEYRESVGLPKVPWGDYWWHSIGLVPEGGGPPQSKSQVVDSSKEAGAGKSVFFLQGKASATLPQGEFFLKKKSLYPEKVKVRLTEAHNAGIEKREKIFVKTIKNEYFYKQRKMILGLLYRDGQKAIIKTIDDVYAFPWDIEADRLRFLTEPYIVDAYEFGQEEMSELFDQFDITINWELIEPRILREIEQSANLVKRITETDRIGIRNILDEIVREGLSTDQAADMIREHYKTFSIPRAETIARTELNAAANNARYIVMETSGVGFHEWAHSLGPDERPDHLATDGVVVLIGETFQPAGLTRPYEPGAAPGSIINCRCTTLPRPDYQGV
jgi:HK97 family phage portal protein